MATAVQLTRQDNFLGLALVGCHVGEGPVVWP